MGLGFLESQDTPCDLKFVEAPATRPASTRKGNVHGVARVLTSCVKLRRQVLWGLTGLS